MIVALLRQRLNILTLHFYLFASIYRPRGQTASLDWGTDPAQTNFKIPRYGSSALRGHAPKADIQEFVIHHQKKKPRDVASTEQSHQREGCPVGGGGAGTDDDGMADDCAVGGCGGLRGGTARD